MSSALPHFPLRQMPFTITEVSGVAMIALAHDAGRHAGLVTERSTAWIANVHAPIAIDFAHVPLLNSVLIGWIFQLIIVGKLTSFGVHRASRKVLEQMRQSGLSKFLTKAGHVT
jgi:anti-anti-sigma regulatory factor